MLAEISSAGSSKFRRSESRMKQIKYSDDSFELREEFPERIVPNAESITDVTIALADTGGEEILAATSATLYTATTLDADASAGDAYVTFANGATALNRGDRVLIGDSDDGPPEMLVCHHYDATNRRAYGEYELQHAHASGAAVVGLWATYDLDVSDTDTYVKGYQLVGTWDPDTDDEAWTERYIISGTATAAAAGLWKDMRAIYPSVYEEATKGDLVTLEAHIRQRFAHEFVSRGMELNRIVDNDRIQPGLLLFARYVILIDPERKSDAKEEWGDWFKTLCGDSIWQDLDEDGALEDHEKETHGFDCLEQHI